MTNEEIARKVASSNRLDFYEMEDALKDVAEWKDRQFKDIIAQVRKWLDEQGKLDQLDLLEFDMEIEKCWEGRK